LEIGVEVAVGTVLKSEHDVVLSLKGVQQID
jgi:hypothetical protein